MPAHAVRAYDKADELNNGVLFDPQLEQIARNHIKQTSLSATYAAKEAWAASQAGPTVQFVSTLCGELFHTPPDTRVDQHALLQESAWFQFGIPSAADAASSPQRDIGRVLQPFSN
jgi:hypothetical protein